MRRLVPHLLLALQLLGVTDLVTPRPPAESHPCCCSGAAAAACAGACECACGAPMPGARMQAGDTRAAGECTFTRGRCGRPEPGATPIVHEPGERPLAPVLGPRLSTAARATVAPHRAPRRLPAPPSPPPRG